MVDGTPFGPYRLIELLGRGGMGEVWRAYDTTTSRVVAVKVLTSELAADSVYKQRFQREALAAAGLTEPHVVPIHNFGEIDGRLYVDMRLIEGRDLEQLLADGPLPAARAVHIVEQIAAALNAAHRIGLVHRDVKPSNILVTEDDFAYLIDFGIARSATETGLTGTGTTIGTLAYMAPERFDGNTVDARSDVYALACVLYQALTGHQPYPGSTFEQLLAGHLQTPPPQPSITAPTVPVAMDAVIAHGMAKNPDQRYPSTRDLAHAARTAITTPIPATQHAPGPHPALQPRTQLSPHHTQLAPTQQHPASQPPAQWPPPPEKPRRTKLLLTGIATTLAVIALIAVLAVTLTGNDDTTTADPTTTSSTPTATPNEGPLTGTFSVSFGPQTNWAGIPDPAGAPAKETWTFRSDCPDSGCVATAEAGGPVTETPDWIFDDVNGQWIAVSVGPGRCNDIDAEYWRIIHLKESPDGSLKGEYGSISAAGCATKHTVSLTRTGDTDVAELADPDEQPKRVASPAEGLHGNYHNIVTDLEFGEKQEIDLDFRTDCLRTGDRCVSVLSQPGTDLYRLLLFADEKWTQTDEFVGECPGFGTIRAREIAEYRLPQPATDPIASLDGTGRREVNTDSPCRGGTFTSTFTRNGD